MCSSFDVIRQAVSEANFRKRPKAAIRKPQYWTANKSIATRRRHPAAVLRRLVPLVVQEARKSPS